MQRHLLLVAALLALVAPAALAQGVTTAALNGIVTDTQGDPLPGANVIAVHEPTGTQYGTVTRPDGRFNLVNVQVGGPYTVTASFVGFRAARESGFNLALGENRQLAFRLQEDVGELGQVEVLGTADATFDASRTGASTNVSTEQIERLPTIARSIQDFTRLSPQVAGNNVGGRNNRYNNIQLDGAILNDAFGLPASGTPGGQVGAQPVSLDAIAEFQVEAAPYDVRRSGFTGGLINAVTRRGTNDFQGSGYFFGRNEALVGLSPDANQTPFEEFGEYQTGFRLGGPIQRNRAFFFLSGEISQRNEPLLAGLAGTGAANEFVADAATLQRVVDIAQGYGLDPGSFAPFTVGTGDAKLFGRLDMNLAQNHRLTLRHNFVDAATDRGLFRSRTSWTLTDQAYAFRSRQNSTVAQLNSSFGANLFTEARLGYTAVRDQRDYGTRPPAPGITIYLDGGQRIDLGQERSSQANALSQDILEFTANATYFTGDLTFTFGTDNQYNGFDNLFIQDFYGTYEFQGIEAFEAGQVSRYRFSYANPNTPGVPEQPRAAWSYFRAGAFGQAEWRALPTLNLTGGLRVDVPFFLDDPLYNPTVEEAFGLRTDDVPTANPQISPRLAFNWDTFGDRSTQVRGGVGVFSGPPLGVWLSNQYSNTGVDLLRVDAFRATAQSPAEFFQPDPALQPRPGQTAGLAPINTTAIALTSEDFTFPQVLRASFGVDQRLPVYGLNATAEVQFSPVVNDVLFQNINLGDQVGTSATDGRPIFTPRDDPRFTSVILMSNTNQGYTTNMTLQLERPARDGFFGTVAYNFQRARDVNSGGSSVALSNWNGNPTQGDPNAEVLGTSLWEMPHRALAAVSYRNDFISPRWATTVSFIYEGQSGAPFSYIYNGDANGDGERFNDLVYVPASQNEIVISDADWARLDAFIDEDPFLSQYRGEIFERNAARAPWSNRIDLRIAQEVPTLRGQRLELTADVLNVGNLLNNEWGRLRTVGRTYTLMNFQGYAEDGRARIALPNNFGQEVASPADLASRWQMQLGLRYSF